MKGPKQNSEQLKKHNKTHKQDSPFDGYKCDKTFKTSAEMKIHESTKQVLK